jgi:DNA-binding LacI/PurR family transcriptional regulator
LRNSPLVQPETRARIQEIARALHYQVDRSAAGLRTQRSRTLALLLFEDPTVDDSQINPFFLSMLGHITRAAARRKFDLLMSFQQLSDDWQAEYEASNRADGMILLGYGDYVSYADRLRRLTESKAHFIIWGAPVVEGEPGHSLCCDNIQGAYEATRHLVQLGRRSIAFAGGASEHCPEFQHRYQGYAQALREAGLESDERLQADAYSQEDAGYRAGLQLLDSGVPFDAVFGASDLIAIGVIRALQDRGRRVPEDVGVVGFDDISSAAYFNPPLTTVQQDTKLAGELLVDNLIKLIEGRPVEATRVPPRLIVRSSCGSRLVRR